VGGVLGALLLAGLAFFLIRRSRARAGVVPSKAQYDGYGAGAGANGVDGVDGYGSPPGSAAPMMGQAHTGNASTLTGSTAFAPGAGVGAAAGTMGKPVVYNPDDPSTYPSFTGAGESPAPPSPPAGAGEFGAGNTSFSSGAGNTTYNSGGNASFVSPNRGAYRGVAEV